MSSALIIAWEHFLFNCEKKNKFKVIALRVLLFYTTAASKKNMVWFLMFVLLTAKIDICRVLELHSFPLFLSGSRRRKLKIVNYKVQIDVRCHFFAFKMLVQCIRNIYEGYLGKQVFSNQGN